MAHCGKCAKPYFNQIRLTPGVIQSFAGATAGDFTVIQIGHVSNVPSSFFDQLWWGQIILV